MPLAPSDDADEFAALVAARLLYDMHASHYNAQMQVTESLARMTSYLLSPSRKPAWRDLDDAERQKWLDRGKEAVALVLHLEAMGR